MFKLLNKLKNKFTQPVSRTFIKKNILTRYYINSFLISTYGIIILFLMGDLILTNSTASITHTINTIFKIFILSVWLFSLIVSLYNKKRRLIITNIIIDLHILLLILLALILESILPVNILFISTKLLVILAILSLFLLYLNIRIRGVKLKFVFRVLRYILYSPKKRVRFLKKYFINLSIIILLSVINYGIIKLIKL